MSNSILRLAAVSCMLTQFTVPGRAVAAASSSPEPAPNILFILVDDLGYQDLSCQGSPDIRTPNIDALARSGLRCTAGYVTAPQCAPSRAGLLTGLNQARFGFLDNLHHQGIPSSAVSPSIADILKGAGYATGMIGKWHLEPVDAQNRLNNQRFVAGTDGLGKTERPPQFQEIGPADRPASAQPQACGFDSFVMIDGGLSHYFPYSPSGSKFLTSRGFEPRLYAGETKGKPHFIDHLPSDTYLTDYFSTRAVDYIRQNRDRPWFLYLAYNAPHSPLMAPKEDVEANAHIPDLNRRTFAGMMTALDRGVGRVMAALDESGQRRRTLVLFISDNGGPTHKTTSRNDPLRGEKGDVFEGGIRVPFICSWPGVLPAGKTFDDPVSTLDLLPTFATLVGKPVPANAEGVDLLPALKGQPTALADRTLYWRWRDDFLAIRSGALKEVRNGGQGGGFYNLVDNISERDDKQIRDPAVRERLAHSLDRWNAQLEREAAAKSGQ